LPALRTSIDLQVSAAQLELIAAYVSGLNSCQYCYGVHSETVKAFGIDENTLAELLEHPESAPIDENLRAILRYAKKLTLTPSRMTQADANAVLAAGWCERALHDAVLTICLFNFMNRLLEGHGCKGNQQIFAARGKSLKNEGYAPLLKLLK